MPPQPETVKQPLLSPHQGANRSLGRAPIRRSRESAGGSSPNNATLQRANLLKVPFEGTTCRPLDIAVGARPLAGNAA